MSKIQYQGSKLCCSECGKNQAKYREFVGAWLCNACFNKFNIKELKKIERDNKQKARKKNKEVQIEEIKEPEQIEEE